MARPSLDLVLSHWCKPFENFQASAMAFYSAVEAALKRREIPDAATSRIDWKEGGLLAAKREYLRVSRGKHVVDICAAPFGTGFFFSSWLAETPPSLGVLWAFLLFIAAVVLFSLFLKLFGVLVGLFVSIIAFPIFAWLLGRAVQQGILGSEDAVIAIPVIGWLYVWIFKPATYYKIDTALMFQSAVHAAVLEVIDELTTAKGLRALSELERKPILREFGRR